MSFLDFKISSASKLVDTSLQKLGVSSLPDRPTIGADILKSRFDFLAALAAQTCNDIIKLLDSKNGASNIGAEDCFGNSGSVQSALAALVTLIGSEQIAAVVPDGGLTTGQIADSAITDDKLQDRSVTGNKISTGAVGSDALASSSVLSTHLSPRCVGEMHLDQQCVTSYALSTGAVTESKLSDNAVSRNKIAGNAVTTTELADSAVSTAKIASKAVTGDKIADNAILPRHLSFGCVGLEHLGSDVEDAFTKYNVMPYTPTMMIQSCGSAHIITGYLDVTITPPSDYFRVDVDMYHSFRQFAVTGNLTATDGSASGFSAYVHHYSYDNNAMVLSIFFARSDGNAWIGSRLKLRASLHITAFV